MSDVVLVVITLVFFVVAGGLVTACDRLIGPDDELADELTDEPDLIGVPR